MIAYTVQLPNAVAAEIDAIAASCEIAKSQIIREVVVDWLFSRALWEWDRRDSDTSCYVITHYLARALNAKNRAT